MDVHKRISAAKDTDIVIHTVDMHTSGEPTRIVVSGYPELRGHTLLQKRAYAKEQLDHLRTRLMWEPRGHTDMYGALLVQTTEMTESGHADIGVLFMHNEGYSTMCGHGTIALGRFLIDTQDRSVFPLREQLKYDAEKRETELRLHAPCGVVHVTVPTVMDDGKARSDESRPVTFISVPSFASARDVYVDIPETERWAALRAKGGTQVRVDVAYGGAFYAIVEATELGFEGIVGRGISLRELDEATATLKRLLAGRRELVRHPSEPELEYLYGAIVTDEAEGARRSVGLCFFAEQEVDRSPCGSGVSARVAAAVAAGRMAVGETALFDSPVSVGGGGGFTGTAVAEVAVGGAAGVRVAVGGRGGTRGRMCLCARAATRGWRGSCFATP
ncbi:proline racemase family [Fomitopsis serialis]|uniref:proline racemase family n=1 Tax=Fomitopsis serialis TaxID=139415 RepID=UPI002007D871|nr:proline racemase family [Neoantrodia serialis]KAH9935441.1 proline racemase family [Neoantrodia serialis]